MPERDKSLKTRMSTKLNKRQRIAAEMLGLGHRPSAVASKLSVSRETISRWQQDDTFLQFVQHSHIDLLNTLLTDKLALLNTCHDVISKALSNDDESIMARANLAARYLTLSGTQSNIYGGIERRHDFMQAKDERDNQSFRRIMDILHKLAALKGSNNNFSDAEYRKRAEEIVRAPRLND